MNAEKKRAIGRYVWPVISCFAMAGALAGAWLECGFADTAIAVPAITLILGASLWFVVHDVRAEAETGPVAPVDEEELARQARERADEWAQSPPGTPYGSTTPNTGGPNV